MSILSIEWLPVNHLLKESYLSPSREVWFTGPNGVACDSSATRCVTSEPDCQGVVAKTLGLVAGRFFEAGEGVLQRLLLHEREQECQRGLGALVLAQAIHVQAVTTAAGARIREREAQIIPT